MPAPRPAYETGCFYHLFNRGAHGVSIFREPDNYLFVLRGMKRYCMELALTPVAYCLMPNHYHWLIRQDADRPAGMLPQRVFNSYSRAYNKAYGHSGTLFEDNYRVVPVVSEMHLLQLCRYIHANPVKDGLVDDPEQWPYSNYLEWIGARAGTMVDRELVHSYFPTREAYRAFVQAFVEDRRLHEALRYLA